MSAISSSSLAVSYPAVSSSSASSSSAPYTLRSFPIPGERPGIEFKGNPELFTDDDAEAPFSRTDWKLNIGAINFEKCTKISDAAIIIVMALTSQNKLPLRLINLRACPITDYAIGAIAKADCSKLHKLDLSDCTSFKSESLLYLLAKEDCRQLADLRLVNCPSIRVEDAKKIIRTTRNLHSLSLSRLAIDLEFITILTERHPNLNSLELSGCEFDSLSWSKMPDSLEEVDFSDSPSVNATSIEFLVGRCKNLRRINVSYCAEVNHPAVELIAINCLQLQSISLASCPIENQSIAILPAKCPALASIGGLRSVDLGAVKEAAKTLGLSKEEMDKVESFASVSDAPSRFRESIITNSLSKPVEERPSCVIQ